ncbi:MAG: hypothetical protein OEW42_01190 [Acidimicrobiia bacterium]|nr:hypothetical protein [Acidimicrobiia bacterium]
MLELPEVETIRRDLDRELTGKKIKSVEAESMAVLGHYNNRKSFTSRFDGQKFLGVGRRGLTLLVAMDSDETLVISLGPDTNLIRATNRAADIAGTEVVFTFTQHGGLRVVDPTGGGDLHVCATDELDEEHPEFASLGIDPIEEPMSWTRFGEMLMQRGTKLKTLITDDAFLIGIGELYADEILFTAGLRHDRLSNTLSTQEVRRLYRALVETLHEAIKHRGTTLEGGSYRDAFGEPGGYAEHLQVYGRDGDLSPRSRTPIQRVKFGGSWTYYCDTQV